MGCGAFRDLEGLLQARFSIRPAQSPNRHYAYGGTTGPHRIRCERMTLSERETTFARLLAAIGQRIAECEDVASQPVRSA